MGGEGGGGSGTPNHGNGRVASPDNTCVPIYHSPEYLYLSDETLLRDEFSPSDTVPKI